MASTSVVVDNSFIIDAPSFQKLLEAAWVLQCGRDRGLSQCGSGAPDLAVPLGNDELKLILPASRGEACEADRSASEPRERQICAVTGRRDAPGASVVAPPYPQGEIAGLALVADCESSLAQRAFQSASACFGPLAVLLVMTVFLLFQRDRHPSSIPSVNALSKPSASVLDNRQWHDDVVQPVSDTTMSIKSTRNLQLALEPSHSHITDSQTLVVVEDMSGYEVKNLRRQAQYGDGDSAFTLGMAYEIGRHVPQSCAQAAKWVAVAAAEGKPAAQYNLGIRQAYGDGTPTNLKEAKKRIQEAAAHGYKKAERAMEAMGGVR